MALVTVSNNGDRDKARGGVFVPAGGTSEPVEVALSDLRLIESDEDLSYEEVERQEESEASVTDDLPVFDGEDTGDSSADPVEGDKPSEEAINLGADTIEEAQALQTDEGEEQVEHEPTPSHQDPLVEDVTEDQTPEETYEPPAE